MIFFYDFLAYLQCALELIIILILLKRKHFFTSIRTWNYLFITSIIVLLLDLCAVLYYTFLNGKDYFINQFYGLNNIIFLILFISHTTFSVKIINFANCAIPFFIIINTYLFYVPNYSNVPALAIFFQFSVVIIFGIIYLFHFTTNIKTSNVLFTKIVMCYTVSFSLNLFSEISFELVRKMPDNVYYSILIFKNLVWVIAYFYLIFVLFKCKNIVKVNNI